MGAAERRAGAVASAIAPDFGSEVAERRVRGRSLLHYSPWFVVVAVLVADYLRGANPDLWSDLLIGRAILHGHLWRHDAWSYTIAGAPLVDHEWLAQTVMALFYGALGVFGLKLYKLCFSAATIVLVAIAEGETGASRSVQAVVLMGTAVALSPFMQMRPQVMSYALMAALMVLLARYNFRGRARLWLAVPLLWLWASVHGAWAAGWAALAVWAAAIALIDRLTARPARRAAMLTALTAAALLVTIVNPFGLSLWRIVLHTAFTPAVATIAEWQPLLKGFFAMLSVRMTIFYSLWLLAMAALIVLTALEPAANDFAMLAIAAPFIAASFWSVRNVPLALIVIVVPLTRRLGMLTGDSQSLSRSMGWWRALLNAPVEALRAIAPMPAEPALADATAASGRSRLSALVIAVLALFIAYYSGLFSNRLPNVAEEPIAAFAFMQQHGLHGNVLCKYAWGGYLIWYGTPRDKVFIDPRFQTVYPPAVIDDYLAFAHGPYRGARWKRALTAYPTQFVLISPRAHAFAQMRRADAFRLIYRDKVAALFAREGAGAAPLSSAEPFTPGPAGFFP